MHREEAGEMLSCAGCGGPVGTRERAYAFGAESTLCFRCGVERGGSYDAEADRWTRSPDVSDLAEPER